MIRNKDLEGAIYDYIKKINNNSTSIYKIINQFLDNYTNTEINHALNHLHVNKCIIKITINNTHFYKINYNEKSIYFNSVVNTNNGIFANKVKIW